MDNDYIDIKNRIEAILESNLPIIDKEYKNLLLDSIMTTLRDSGLQPYGFSSNVFSMSDYIKRDDAIQTVHKSMWPFLDDFNGEFSDNDKLLLKVNKEICNNLKKVKASSIYGEMKEAEND